MGGRARIVVVDDDPSIRALIEMGLKHHGFEPIVFGDAREALAALPELGPDLIVSDLLMPGMDGWSFFQEVKRCPGVADVPFLFLTAVRSDQMVETSLDGGADDVLSKPFSPKTLASRIRATLRRSRRSPGGSVPLGRLQGGIEPTGIVSVLQFLEGNRLSARLSVAAGGKRWEVRFERGEIAGIDGPGDERDRLKELLRLTDGTWLIETQEPPAARPANAATGPPPAPSAEPRAAEPAEETVDGLVLAAAVQAVAERVGGHLDAAATETLLKRSHAMVARNAPALKGFKLARGAVTCPEPLPASAVAGVAAWLVSFLREAGELSPKAGRIQVRKAAAAHEAALDEIGFHAALDAARRASAPFGKSVVLRRKAATEDIADGRRERDPV